MLHSGSSEGKCLIAVEEVEGKKKYTFEDILRKKFYFCCIFKEIEKLYFVNFKVKVYLLTCFFLNIC